MTDITISALMANKSPVSYLKSCEYTWKRGAMTACVGALGGIAFGKIGGLAVPLIVKAISGGATAAGLKTVSTFAQEGRPPTEKEVELSLWAGSIAVPLGEGGSKLVGLTPKQVHPTLGSMVTGATSSDVVEGVLTRVLENDQESADPTPPSSIEYTFGPADPDILLNREGN